MSASVGLPEVAVWPLVVLLSFGAASLMTAALHGPWWLKILGLIVVLMISGTWTLRSRGAQRRPGLAGGRGGDHDSPWSSW